MEALAEDADPGPPFGEALPPGCALAALAACFLGGCSERQEEPAPLARGQYNVYYLNASMTELVSQVYETQETDPALLVEELMSQFLTVPSDLRLPAGS